MRRLMIALFVALATAVPATAQEPPVPTPPCEASTDYGVLGLAGKHQDVATPTTPSATSDPVGGGYTDANAATYKYRLDLSGSEAVPDAGIATVRVVVTWDNTTDFDLHVYDASGSELGSDVRFNPQTNQGLATLTLAEVPQCTDLRVVIVNFLGLPTTTMDLDVTVSNPQPAPPPEI